MEQSHFDILVLHGVPAVSNEPRVEDDLLTVREAGNRAGVGEPMPAMFARKLEQARSSSSLSTRPTEKTSSNRWSALGTGSADIPIVISVVSSSVLVGRQSITIRWS